MFVLTTITRATIVGAFYAHLRSVLRFLQYCLNTCLLLAYRVWSGLVWSGLATSGNFILEVERMSATPGPGWAALSEPPSSDDDEGTQEVGARKRGRNHRQDSDVDSDKGMSVTPRFLNLVVLCHLRNETGERKGK